MRIQLLLLLILVNLTYSQKVQQYVNNFITLYNDGKFEEIVLTFASKYQTQNVYDEVVQQLSDIRDTHGDILTNMTVTVNSQGHTFMVTFKDDLSVGALAVRVQSKKILFGMISVLDGSSFVDYVDKNSDNISFKFIFDDATISKNSGDSFGVEALQIFPVSMEYCNQLSQGKLKSSKMVSKKEVQKYYISGYDDNFRNFQLFKSSSQSLGSLVKQNLKTPSLAVSEYLVDLLGLDNVENTMDSLGISQDRTMYPASYYVQMASLRAGQSSDTNFMSMVDDLSDSDITDGNKQIHSILKTGNSTASKLIQQTISQLKSKSPSLKDAINMKNTISSAGDYADAYYSFVTKDFELDGNSNTIYNNFVSLKSSEVLNMGRFGSSYLTQFEGNSLSGTVSYKYEAIGAYNAPKNSNYKSLGFSVILSGSVTDDQQFLSTFVYFLLHVLRSPAYRSAAEDAF